MADPIKEAMKNVKPVGSIPTPHTSTSQDREIEALRAHVASLGKDMEILKNVQSYRGPSLEPNETLLRSLWTQVYLSIINQIFAKGLAYWNNKLPNLKMELELAVIRADESVEAYIRTRNVTPDPVDSANARWAREQLNKAL